LTINTKSLYLPKASIDLGSPTVFLSMSSTAADKTKSDFVAPADKANSDFVAPADKAKSGFVAPVVLTTKSSLDVPTSVLAPAGLTTQSNFNVPTSFAGIDPTMESKLAASPTKTNNVGTARVDDFVAQTSVTLTEESRAGILQGVDANLQEPASPVSFMDGVDANLQEPASPASFMGSVSTKNKFTQTMIQPAVVEEPWVSIKHIKTVTN
jgi:hypothetical protein